MGHTKRSQRAARTDLNEKLSLSTPSRAILEDLAVQCASHPSPDNTFQYAFCMSKSTERSELAYAVKILDGLVSSGYEHQVDCMYGAATALYLLGEYDDARTRCESILRAAPDRSEATELHLACIDAAEEQRTRNMAVGGTAAVGAIGLVAVVAGMILSKGR